MARKRRTAPVLPPTEPQQQTTPEEVPQEMPAEEVPPEAEDYKATYKREPDA